MAKVASYHSSNPTDPPVYHDHDDCPAGNEIPDANRQQGTGGYTRCEHCQKFASPAGGDELVG